MPNIKQAYVTGVWLSVLISLVLMMIAAGFSMLKLKTSSSAPDAVLNFLTCRPILRVFVNCQCHCLENRLKCTNAELYNHV